MVNKEILTYVVADAIIMNIFLMLNFSTNPSNRNIELTILYLGASAVVMTIVSFLLYYLYFKKRKT
jgi:hypothetical protein